MIKKYLLFSVLMTTLTNAQNVTAGNNVGDTGQTELIYQDETVNYKTVRAADGYEWLQQNLGSKQIATTINDEAAYGDYFQWGRWDDGHQLKNSETSEDYPTPNNPLGLGKGNPLFFINGGSPWSSNYDGWFANPNQDDSWNAKNIAEITANNGMDPCKAIGEKWEIPTEADWTNLMEKEKINPKDDSDSRNGITRAFESNLKIVGAGARKDNSFAFVGQRAYIWTKSASANPNFYRYVYLSGAIAGFGGDAKSHGYTVRCVNKSSNLTITDQQLNKNKIYAVVQNDVLKIVSGSKIKNLKLYNTNGQLILSSFNDNINISKLNHGIYFAIILSNDDSTTTLKFIKK